MELENRKKLRTMLRRGDILTIADLAGITTQTVRELFKGDFHNSVVALSYIEVD